nr:helix-turn-helix domain-containing protein [Allomuricauda sp.]
MIELFWIKSLLHFLIFFLCGLILLILFKQKDKIAFRHWGISILVFLLLHLLGFLRFTSWINSSSALITTAYSYGQLLYFVLGPVLFIKLEQLPRKPAILLHFVPAVVGAFLLYANPGVEQLLVITGLVHFIVYAVALLFVSKTMANATTEIGGYKKVVGLWGLSFLLHCLELVLWSQLGWLSETWAWVLFCLSEALLGYSLLYLIYMLATGKSKLKSNGDSGLPKEIRSHLENLFPIYITKPSVFTDPLINQQKVAKALNVSPHHVSRYLSHHYGDSFLNIINSQRIEESKKKLANPKLQHLSIQDIYYEVGFNSKSTFNTAFKKNTGITPSEYRKQSKKED